MTKSILQLAQKTRSRCFTSDNRENNRLIVEDSSARRLQMLSTFDSFTLQSVRKGISSYDVESLLLKGSEIKKTLNKGQYLTNSEENSCVDLRGKESR